MIGFFDSSAAGDDDTAVEPLADLGPALSRLRWYRMCVARATSAKASLIPNGAVVLLWSDGEYEARTVVNNRGEIESVSIDVGVLDE
jgi:hypothetical protein